MKVTVMGASTEVHLFELDPNGWAGQRPLVPTAAQVERLWQIDEVHKVVVARAALVVTLSFDTPADMAARLPQVAEEVRRALLPEAVPA